MIGKDVEQLIRKHALQNAIQYGGTGKARSVMGKVLSERPDLKQHVRQLGTVIEVITREINKLSLSKQIELFEQFKPETAPVAVSKEMKTLPPLPNVEKYPVVHVRFCPNPDGALHLGGARAAILDDEYTKMYNGKFTLRFDDTDPRTKSPLPEAYNWIENDLEWLNVNWQEKVYQSDRLEIYYRYATQLIKGGAAYVCSCRPIEFRKLIAAHKPCPCRNLSSGEHVKRWNKMIEGFSKEGEAVVRIKTDLNYPNPAVREWPALRVIDTDKYPHPRTGNKYRVWPLFAFCCGIDDHDLRISHVIRGKEHLTNSVRQQFLYNYLNWEAPEAIHYGRFKIIGGILSKSKIRANIAKGIYKGWDDPRLGTLMALRRRGFLPKTIRQIIVEAGPKPVDATISMDNVQALNRKHLDPQANRYFFVANPLLLVVKNVRKGYITKLPLHPSNHKRGSRVFRIEPDGESVFLQISKNDLRYLETENVVRLMGLFNISMKNTRHDVVADFHSEEYSEAKKLNAPLIHWIPHGTGVKASIVMADASKLQGLAEDSCRTLKQGDIVQFERFGFVRVDSITENEIVAYYAHR